MEDRNIIHILFISVSSFRISCYSLIHHCRTPTRRQEASPQISVFPVFLAVLWKKMNVSMGFESKAAIWDLNKVEKFISCERRRPSGKSVYQNHKRQTCGTLLHCLCLIYLDIWRKTVTWHAAELHIFLPFLVTYVFNFNVNLEHFLYLKQFGLISRELFPYS